MMFDTRTTKGKVNLAIASVAMVAIVCFSVEKFSSKVSGKMSFKPVPGLDESKVKRWMIVDPQQGVQANFYSLEDDGVVDFVTKEKFPELFPPDANFENVFKSNFKPVLVMAGAYFPPGQNPTIEGLGVDSSGQIVGQGQAPDYRGVLSTDGSGKPEITSVAANDLMQLALEVQEKGGILLTQKQVVKDGRLALTSASDAEFKWHIFVERKTPAGSTYGVVVFLESCTLNEAAETLMDLKNQHSHIENALLLDVGVVGMFAFIDQNGRIFSFADQNNLNLNSFNNYLLFR